MLKQNLFLLICIIMAIIQLIVCQLPQNSSVTPYKTPTYQFNLDLPYSKMMYQYYSDYKERILAYYNIGIQGFQSEFQQSYLNSLGLTRDAFENYSHKEYKQQIQDTADFFGFDPYELFVSQFTLGLIEPYQNPRACTCVLVQNQQNEFFFAKNFDFNLGAYIGNATVSGEFYKNGKLLYHAQVWPLSMGHITGMRQSSFAITLNARSGSTVAANVQAFLSTGYTSHYLVQLVLQNAQTYDQAVYMLKNDEIDYNVYYCVLGTQLNQGAVIARNINSVENFTTLNNTDPWYIVQTNYDRDLPDPTDDYRRVPAENKIKAIGYSITMQDLFDNVMSQFPNNNDGTILSFMMSPQINYWNMTTMQ